MNFCGFRRIAVHDRGESVRLPITYIHGWDWVRHCANLLFSAAATAITQMRFCPCACAGSADKKQSKEWGDLWEWGLAAVCHRDDTTPAMILPEKVTVQ